MARRLRQMLSLQADQGRLSLEGVLTGLALALTFSSLIEPGAKAAAATLQQGEEPRRSGPDGQEGSGAPGPPAPTQRRAARRSASPNPMATPEARALGPSLDAGHQAAGQAGEPGLGSGSRGLQSPTTGLITAAADGAPTGVIAGGAAQGMLGRTGSRAAGQAAGQSGSVPGGGPAGRGGGALGRDAAPTPADEGSSGVGNHPAVGTNEGSQQAGRGDSPRGMGPAAIAAWRIASPGGAEIGRAHV